ncbi:MAG: hypothetical protein H6730_30350 [Deltaproteobacteria bacterium]|nr:hypothetical protein [Deltaproteobacteria bacterium]
MAKLSTLLVGAAVAGLLAGAAAPDAQAAEPGLTPVHEKASCNGKNGCDKKKDDKKKDGDKSKDKDGKASCSAKKGEGKHSCSGGKDDGKASCSEKGSCSH